MPFGNKNEPESPSFAESTSLEKRKLETQKVLEKYHGERIPVIVERSKSSAKTLALIDKKKYLVPSNMTFGQFTQVIRKKIKLQPDQSICLFVNNVLPPATDTMGKLYGEHKDESGYISCIYSSENSFGL